MDSSSPKAPIESSDKAQPESSDKAQPESSGKAQPESSDKAQQKSSDKAQPESSDKAQQSSSNKGQPESSDKAQQKSSDKAQDASSNKESDPERQRRETVESILKCDPDDYYSLLQLPDTDVSATPDEVTKAYRKRAKLAHPDKNIDRKSQADEAFKRIKRACEKLHGDIEEGGDFHPGAYGGENNGPDNSPPKPTPPPIPDEFHMKIYADATPAVLRLMKNPKDMSSRNEIKELNGRIKSHNEELKKEPSDTNIIKLTALVPNYEILMDLFKKPHTRGNEESLAKVNKTLEDLNTYYGYPRTWIGEPPSDWAEGMKKSSQSAKEKGPADRTDGKGAATDSSGSNTSSFKGVRTREGEPILGYRRVGRDGRQYLVQIGDPQNPEYELRSQAGEDGVGRMVGREYEESPGAVCLGEVDKKFTKEDGPRYLGIKGVAFKPIEVKSDDYRDRYPITFGWAKFQNPTEEHWVFRTTLRRLAGKRDADLDIRDWSLNHGFVPTEDVPPRKILIKNEAYSSGLGRRARAEVKEEDEDRALPPKQVKNLSNSQEELRTRLNNLESSFKTEQASITERLKGIDSTIESKFDQLVALMTKQKA